MRIKLVLLLVLFCALTSFAQNKATVFHTFNVAFPVDWNKWDWYAQDVRLDDYYLTENFFWAPLYDKRAGLQLNWARYSVRQGGYSSVYGAGIDFLDLRVNRFRHDFRYGFNAKAGWGLSPVANDFTFAMHFFVASDIKYFYFSPEVYDYEDEYSMSALFIRVLVGWDLVFDFRITERFGITIGADFMKNILGVGFAEFENGDYEEPYRALQSPFEKSSRFLTGFGIVPYIGASFHF